MAKTLLMKTCLMFVVVALALVLAASFGPFAEDANALPSEGGNIAGKYPPLDTSYQLAEWSTYPQTLPPDLLNDLISP